MYQASPSTATSAMPRDATRGLLMGLRTGQHARALTLQRAHGAPAPGIAREPLIAHRHGLVEADAFVEQIERHVLLPGVELLRAPRRGEGNDCDRPEQLTAAPDFY